MRTLLLALALTACGGGSKKPAEKPAEPLANTAPTATVAAAPAPQTNKERIFAKLRELTDAMCSCKDADCAKHVSDDMTAWSQEEAKRQQDPEKMTEADQQEATKIGTRMGECMQAAMQAGGPTP
jgi:sorbitol-specific phosphotransferase system component IIBC